MNYANQHLNNTPNLIKGLLILILSFSLGGTFLAILLQNTFFANPFSLFGLSLSGLEKKYYFQLFTYFLCEIPTSGFGVDYLIWLCISLYFIWFTLTQISQKISLKRIFIFIITSILSSASFFLLLSSYLPYPSILIGTSPLLYSLAFSYMMLYANDCIHLFHAFTIQAKKLILSLLGINLLIELSNNGWITVFVLLFSVVFSYLYSLLVFDAPNPFPSLQTLEKALKRKKHSSASYSKVYDIRTGEPIFSDEQFLDAMLEKISLYGKESLTPQEKAKMDIISKNK